MCRLSPGAKPQLILLAVLFDIHFEHPGEQPNRFVFDVVILVTQRLAFVDVQNLADIALGVRPNQFMAPWFIDDFSRM